MKKALGAATLGVLLSGLLSVVGCHSAFVDAVVRNQTAQPISLMEVDYPSASFGTQALAPGAEFHYRFKVLGSGPAKFIWTDTAQVAHQATGPDLAEGDEGRLTVTLAQDGVAWRAKFKNRTLAPLLTQPKALMIGK